MAALDCWWVDFDTRDMGPPAAATAAAMAALFAGLGGLSRGMICERSWPEGPFPEETEVFETGLRR